MAKKYILMTQSEKLEVLRKKLAKKMRPINERLSEMPQPFQVSKEYVGGKFQKVGFYKNKKGDVDVRPMK